MDTLPPEIICDIALRVPLKGYFNLKLTCLRINGILDKRVDKCYRKLHTTVHKDMHPTKDVIYIEDYIFNKKHHRDDDLPASIIKFTDNSIVKKWYQFGTIDRANDKPAYVYTNTPKYRYQWFKNGVPHRSGDKPCWVSSTQWIWCVNGKEHRENDKPSTIFKNGSMYWLRDGKLHRDGDHPAMIMPCEGYNAWYKHGQRHRDGKPAITGPGQNYGGWYKDGFPQRDGPRRGYTPKKKSA